MQLTRFDRWLRETFVYETHIRTLSPAQSTPPGIKRIDLPESPMQRYRHLYVTRKSADAEALISILRENTQMFTTEVVERKSWYAHIIAPEGKSFSWRLLSTLFIGSFLLTLGLWVRSLLADPKFREALDDMIKLLQ